MNNLYTEMGSRIALLRHENKMTQAQLAEALDISIKHISEAERGLTCLSLEKLVALCTILSTDLDYLVRGIDKREEEEKSIPSFVIEIFNSRNAKQQELLQEYLHLYQKLTHTK